MENFIGKVIKIVSGDKGVSKDYWIDDSKCKACYECESAFSQWNRRHHCRICGRVFCGNCTRNSIPPPRESADQQWLRVCNYCYRVRQRSDQPAVRGHPHHTGSRGAGSTNLLHPGSLRQQLDSGSLPGVGSSDGSPSLDGSRARSSASSGRWLRGQPLVHRVSSGDLSWSVPPALEDDFGMSLADRDARLLYNQQIEAGALPPDAPPQANSLGEVHRQLFCAAADAHLRAVVQQLLMVESVPQPEVWAPIVSGAAQAVAAYLSPTQMYANGQHDPRQSLKVKKVSDVGRPDDTCVVTGVVVRKGLVHRKMRAYIEYPKVLLLAGSLEYQRETNKLSSFDLMDHDKQYLANAVARLSVVKPDVVLVEGSVARMAQEDLLSRNISVAQKIKSKVLERLARAMGVRVTPTVEHLTPATAYLYIGDCKVFRVEAETINVRNSPSPRGPATAATGGAAPTPVANEAVEGVDGSVMSSSTDPTSGGSAAVSAAGSRTHSRTPSSQAGNGEPLPAAPPPPPEPAIQPQCAVEPGPQAATDHVTVVPGEQAQGGAGGGDSALSQLPPTVAPRPAADDQQAKYTSLSAAMMMKALGSGPNAAAAVALVSAGSGVINGAMPFRPWASSVPQAESAPSAASSEAPAPSATTGGPGGSGSSEATAQGIATAAQAVVVQALTIGGQPGLARRVHLPVPPGPPAPPQVTLMYFEGCRPTTTTVLLKGAGLELLRKLKPVVGFAVLTAWNQRLESAFLSDLLTAAVASAGEEAYAAWPSAINSASGSHLAANSPGLSSSQLSISSLHLPQTLSLGFFRQHADQAIRASVVAASACGVPGILLSISPHCNAWDESLIAEWEQQGFTFPHYQHHFYHHRHHSGHIYVHGRGQGQGHPSQRMLDLQPGSQQLVGAEEDKSTGKVAGQAGKTAVMAAAAVTGVATIADANEGIQGELSLAMVSDGESAEPQVPVQADVGSTVAVKHEASMAMLNVESVSDAADTSSQLDFVPTLSPTTLMSPFIARTAALAASAGIAVPAAREVQEEPGEGRPTPSTTAIDDGQQYASEAVVLEQAAGKAGTATATGANASTEAMATTDDLQGPTAGGSGAVVATTCNEPGVQVPDHHVAVQPPASPGQPGEQEREMQQQQQQSQQQCAVMVLQGQRIYNHQRIFVTCMFRRSRDRNLCDPFQVKQIDYYHRSSDVPLIRYIKMCTQMGWTCPGSGCPEPFTAHESVFFFGCHKLTIFYSTLPPIQALPGEEKNQIWHWTRPIGRGREGAPACRRVPLSQDACYISMGRFLELSFSADGLHVFGRSLHYDHVRYFGLGRTLVCMFPERTSVYVMQLPDVAMAYSQQAQTKWLRQEGAELVQEASDAFDLIELMLGDSPHFGGGGGGGGGGTSTSCGNWEAATAPQMATATGDTVAGDSVAAVTAVAANSGLTPGGLPGTTASVTAAAASAVAMHASSVLTPQLVAVRKDRQSFLALVADCLARCAPLMPRQGSGNGFAGAAVPWDELAISGVRELNRLRAVLAKAVLHWASRLQDPGGFMAHYSRLTSGGGSAGRTGVKSQSQLVLLQPQTQLPLQAAAQPILPSSPRASAPISVVALATGPDAGVVLATAAPAAAPHPQSGQPLQDQHSLATSDGSHSLFSSSSPAAAAYRLGLLPAQAGAAVPTSDITSFPPAAVSELATEHPQHPPPQPAAASDTTAAHALPIPIVPHTSGPLSVHAVAEMVAQQELRGGAELLDGSRALLGTAWGPTAAAATEAGSATQPAAAVRPGHSRAVSRSDLPVGTIASAGLAAENIGAAAPQMLLGHGETGTGGASRAVAHPPGSALVAAGGSMKRLSVLARLSGGGSTVTGVDTASGGNNLAAGQGGGQVAVGCIPRGTSLPRSASVSTIGDMGDLSYMAGIGGDSGAEDNEDGEDGREDADDEEPDHDTFLAFMGSGPHGGPAFQRAASGRGPGGSTTSDRSAARGGRGAIYGDSGDDVADEMADGAYYYRALFSHGVSGEPDGGEVLPQSLLQPPQPLLPTQPLQAQQHPLQPQSEEEEREQHQRSVSVLNGQSSITVAHSSSPKPVAVLSQAGGAGMLMAQSPVGSAPGGVSQLNPVAMLPGAAGAPLPLVPAVEPFSCNAGSGLDGHGIAATAAATAAISTFSRRQLMVQVKRRLESVAAVTSGTNTMARGFIPLPGRATMPPGVNDTIIPIFDNEPTSIIAYALSTRAYQQQINAGYKAIFGKARAESNRDRERDREPAGLQLQAQAVVISEQQHQQHGQAGGPTQGGSQATTPTSATAASGASVFGATQSASAAANGGSGTATATVSGQTANHLAPNAAAVSVAAPPVGSLAPITGVSPATPVAVVAAPPPPPQQPVPPPALSSPPPPPAGSLGPSPDAEWWTVLTSKEACHVRVVFEDEARSMPWARARFSVTAHFAPQFAELRRRCIQGGEAAFVASMCRCKRWESRGGKSNAYFAKTRDDRYIIKSLSKSEKASFMNFAPHYFAHMGRHLLNRDSPTCLAKILGVYSVAFKPQPGTAGLEGGGGGGPAGAAASAILIKELKDREFSQDLLVMENCFYDRPVARIYDLKGSERNRFNADAASRPEDHLEVHLDDNLRRTMHTNPIFVDARSRHQMEAAVWADTSFLAGQDVMDYSLLVGVDKENGVLALAIIDFIRQYTWDKQLETWVKSSGMLGGNGKEPTIISPKQYMRRFRAAMQQYFTAVPGSAGSEVPKDPDATA
ncbi:hypothetical protein Vretifemale_1543 [Volvox reticuliferus]|uniref:1-phosphatidylinositol-3-phosphate 5-kinase n=2 Tax=Volvox reticuliferus TaxID=1737510 RepID=A0A8J4C0L8_9CHLO|nr:hypothetical protein Vretifemale_1543 [Volvox reticuliferus]